VLRLMIGKGTPRGLQDLAVAYLFTLIAVINNVGQFLVAPNDSMTLPMLKSRHSTFADRNFKIETTATGCYGLSQQ